MATEKKQVRITPDQKDLLIFLKRDGEDFSDAFERLVKMSPEELHAEIHRNVDETMQSVVPKGEISG